MRISDWSSDVCSSDLESDSNINPAPDVSYHPVASAPSGFGNRPIVIGFGPCGIFAALTLAQMGFRPIVLERGKPVRERTQDTWVLWRTGSEGHTSELRSLMRTSHAVFCLKKKL